VPHGRGSAESHSVKALIQFASSSAPKPGGDSIKIE
jgi:hypothetical protein